jgi:hypothetical protein
MKKFSITVRRIIREDTVIEIEAENQEEARRKAELEATCVPQEKWDAYDCEYSSD